MPLKPSTLGLALLTTFIAIAALACSSDSTEPAPTIVDDAETRAAAESALLVLSDFPEGWEEQPPEPDDDDFEPAFDNAPQRCRKFFEKDEFAGTLFEIEISEFNGPDGQTVESRVTVLDSVDSADDAFDEMQRILQDCQESVKTALAEYYQVEFQDSSSTVALVDFSMGSIEFPQYGDQTLASRFIFAFAFEGETITSYTDLVDIRHGALVGDFTITTVTDPPDSDLAQHLAQALEPRVAAAWNSITAPVEDE